ncbi:MAG: hypothetical protein HY054_09350 [Proteobacteria bacterium]|nr:hypothetical protein [Pseudomonadota bacterium]
MSQRAHSLAPAPPPGGAPPTQEGVVSFRVHTAALSRPASPVRADPTVVLVTTADGGVLVYPPSDKLAILAAERARRMKSATPANT